MSTKQVIVLRKDLNMRKGKMVAQGAHASMKVFFDRMEEMRMMGQNMMYTLEVPLSAVDWINGSFTKICVSVNSEQELMDVYNRAKAAGIPAALIEDAGLTEFNGVVTKTAVGIGPDTSAKIDLITGSLPLL